MRSGADGFTVDNEGFLYVCTRLGIQISDPAGRTAAVLLKPQEKNPSNAVFAGPALDTLYVTAGDGGLPASDEATGRLSVEAVQTTARAFDVRLTCRLCFCTLNRSASFLLLALLAGLPLLAELKSGPPLPLKLVKDGRNCRKDGTLANARRRGRQERQRLDLQSRPARADSARQERQVSPGVQGTAHHVVSRRARRCRGRYLVDRCRGTLDFRVSPAGRLKMFFGNAGKSAGDNTTQYAFNRPTGVSFAANGDIYVSDGYVNSRVVKYSRNGDFLTQWGKKGTGDGEFNLVHDVAVDSKGLVYVADRDNNRVQVFDANGKFITKWNDLGSPWGLIFDPKENVLFMSDGVNNRVLKLNLDGQIVGVLGSFGKSPGKFDFPHNIAVDSKVRSTYRKSRTGACRLPNKR